MKHTTLTLGTFIKYLYAVDSFFENKNLYNKYIINDDQIKPLHKAFIKFLSSKKIVTKKEHSKTSNVHYNDIPFNYVIEYGSNDIVLNGNSFIDFDDKNNQYMLTLYNRNDISENLLKLEIILFMEFYADEILDMYKNSKEIHCSECNEPSDEFNTDKYGKVICDECSAGSHCFCSGCGEFVPTSEINVVDSVLDVDGMEIEETNIYCSECNESIAEDEPSWCEDDKQICDGCADKPSQDHRGEDKNDEPKTKEVWNGYGRGTRTISIVQEENSKPKLLTLYGDKDSKYALEFMIGGNGGWKYQLYFYRENELIDQIGLKKSYLEKMLKFIKDNKEIK